jgi:hypothetical protein
MEGTYFEITIDKLHLRVTLTLQIVSVAATRYIFICNDEVYPKTSTALNNPHSSIAAFSHKWLLRWQRHLILIFLRSGSRLPSTPSFLFTAPLSSHMLNSDRATFLILLSSLLTFEKAASTMYSPDKVVSVPERVRYYDRSVLLMDRLAAM